MKTMLSERINEAMAEAAVTPKELADACGVRVQSVYQWQSGVTKKLEGLNLHRAARRLGVNEEWLGTGLGQKRSDSAPVAEPNIEPVIPLGVRRIPVIGYVQAGIWTEAADPYPMGSGSETISTTEDLGPNAFALRIKGDSNYPDYKEGEIVIIDPSVTPIPGDMVVAKNGEEEATFKKYRPRGTDDSGKDVFELVPLNDDYPTLRSDRDGPMRIIGTMVEHRRFRRR